MNRIIINGKVPEQTHGMPVTHYDSHRIQPGYSGVRSSEHSGVNRSPDHGYERRVDQEVRSPDHGYERRMEREVRSPDHDYDRKTHNGYDEDVVERAKYQKVYTNKPYDQEGADTDRTTKKAGGCPWKWVLLGLLALLLLGGLIAFLVTRDHGGSHHKVEGTNTADIEDGENDQDEGEDDDESTTLNSRPSGEDENEGTTWVRPVQSSGVPMTVNYNPSTPSSPSVASVDPVAAYPTTTDSSTPNTGLTYQYPPSSSSPSRMPSSSVSPQPVKVQPIPVSTSEVASVEPIAVESSTPSVASVSPSAPSYSSSYVEPVPVDSSSAYVAPTRTELPTTEVEKEKVAKEIATDAVLATEGKIKDIINHIPTLNGAQQ